MKIAIVCLGIIAIALSGPQAALGAGSAGPDIRVYKTVGDAKLSVHIFHPASGVSSAKKLAPAILLFHGGGWVAGSPEWVYEPAQRYAGYGAVAVAVEYRLSDQKTVTPIDALSDARDAMRWTRAHAAELGIDPERIAAYGVSAGGQLAGALATIEDPVHPDSLDVPSALVMISPAVSVVHDGWFARILLNRAAAAALSPDQHITKRVAPTIIFHGVADSLVPISGVRGFCDLARQHGSECEVVEYPGVGHLFTRRLDEQEDNFDPEPKDVADSHARGDAFFAKHGFLPEFSGPAK